MSFIPTTVVNGPPKDYLSATLVTVGCIAVLDALYIGVFARKHWQNQIAAINDPTGSETNARLSAPEHGNLQIRPSGGHRRLWAAGIAYVVMVGAILGLVVSRVNHPESAFVEGLLWGAVLGFSVYAIFNFTNLAIFANYTWQSALMDTSWGTFLMAITGGLAAYTATHCYILPIRQSAVVHD